MKILRRILLYCGAILSLNSAHIDSGGLIPAYAPDDLQLILMFLPYNPNILLIGDRTAPLALEIAATLDYSTVYSFSTEPEDFELLNSQAEQLPNIHPHLGLFPIASDAKIHFMQLNCEGTELQILATNPELVRNAIVVSLKTYHRPIRNDLPLFEDLHSFMTSCDFELVSHRIYNKIIGDALYVKSNYVTAVFRSQGI